MPQPGRRLLAWLMPAAVLMAGGCFGSPAQPVTTVKRKTARTAATAPSASPSQAPLPSPGAPASLRNPTPKPTRAPIGGSPTPNPGVVTPSKAPTPTPRLTFPPITAQPVELNQTASGPGPGTENFMVLSAAVTTTESAFRVSVDDGRTSNAYRMLSLAPPPLPVAAGRDAHMRFRRWQATQPPPPAARPYRLQAAATPKTKGADVDFYVITNFDSDHYRDVKVRAKVLEVGEHCYVLVDKAALVGGAATTLGKRANEIATTFDSEIYPTDTRLFGSEPIPGVDGDRRVYILLSPAVGNYGDDNTLGYFSQRDEFTPQADSPAVYQHSNAKEMLYVSSRIVLSGSPDDYLGTLAHEFQHMINFNQKVLLGKNRASDDLWIDEGMAMYAIEANGYGLKAGGSVLGNHVKRYQQSPAEFSLTDWDDNPDAIGYGPVYLFMVYLADRFSENVVREIVTSTKIGTSNLDEVLGSRGTTFNQVFHDWALANLLDGRPQVTDPIHQYKSLEMAGANGVTKLAGFEQEPLPIPGNEIQALRPYTIHYYELPHGPVTPHFTLTSFGASAVQTRLVLP